MKFYLTAFLVSCDNFDIKDPARRWVILMANAIFGSQEKDYAN